MTNSTIGRRRFTALAAAVAATAAVTFGAAACGTETAADVNIPDAPVGGAPGANVQQAPHFPTSADAAEKRAQLEYLEQLRRHYTEGIENKKAKKYQPLTEQQTGHWRDIPLR